MKRKIYIDTDIKRMCLLALEPWRAQYLKRSKKTATKLLGENADELQRIADGFTKYLRDKYGQPIVSVKDKDSRSVQTLECLR